MSQGLLLQMPFFAEAPGSVHHPRLQPVTLQFLLPQREYMSKGAKR